MLKYKQAILMNVLTSSILPLNNRSFATSTLAPLFCCNRVAICCCRPAIRVRSCFSLIDRACNIGVVDCFVDCCYYCCCWDILDGSDSNGDSLYKDKQSSSFELIASYQLEEWNNIISKKGISKLDGPLRDYCCFPV